MIEKWFRLSEYGTTVETECSAGITTFLTMVYIVLVNPAILSASGIDSGACFVATCLVAIIGCLLSGLMSNYPVAIAPGMALNAYFSYVIVQHLGYSWQVALGAVFVASVIFLIVSITPLRRWLINAIPETMNMAIAAGLGLFIAMLALKTGGLIKSDSATLLTMGDLRSPSTLLFFFTFCFIVVLDYFEVKGALIIGILLSTLVGLLIGVTHYDGIIALPPSLKPTFMHMQFAPLWSNQGFSIIFSFLLVAVFDCAGTFIGVLDQAGLYRCGNHVSRLSRGLFAASFASIIGAVLGTSSVSAYSESAAGVRAGARTGLSTLVVGALFVLTLFFSPLAKTIPTSAVAAAMLFVACLMMKSFTHFVWDDMTDTIPSVVTAFMIPFSFSIADGIGAGFISYVLIKLATKRYRDIHPALYVLVVIFIAYFAGRPA